MNSGQEHKCAVVSAEDLLLFAYGEADDPRLASHAAGCPVCRAFLADLTLVRADAARAGMLEPGLAVVAELKREAAAEVRRHGTRAKKQERAGLLPRWAWAAAMIMAAGIVLYSHEAGRNVSEMAEPARSVPAYLAGVGGQITELESLVGGVGANDTDVLATVAVTGSEVGDSVSGNAFSLDPGAWDLIVEPGVNVDDLELAMNDLESQIDLLGYSDAKDSGTDGDEWDGEHMGLPLLRGIKDKASL